MKHEGIVCLGAVKICVVKGDRFLPLPFEKDDGLELWVNERDFERMFNALHSDLEKFYSQEEKKRRLERLNSEESKRKKLAFTDERLEALKRDRELGMSIRALATKYDCSTRTVQKYLKASKAGLQQKNDT